MGITTKIRWSDSTWNPVTGCDEVSPGCDNCYARVLAERYRGNPAFPLGFDLTLRAHKLRDPLKWKEPKLIFVNSLSDLFHKDIPEDYLATVWATMLQANHHIYQILTKRPHVMEARINKLGLKMASHIWLGVSIELQKFATGPGNRIDPLLRLDRPFGSVRFVSAEPLLGPLDLSDALGAHRVNWLIVGGESGSNRRHMDFDWVRSLRDQAAASDVALFFKQGNAFRPDQDKVLDGERFDEYPQEVNWLTRQRTLV